METHLLQCPELELNALHEELVLELGQLNTLLKILQVRMLIH